jgi:hypothetical protein
MATFIDGIAASENIDSSGERIQIQGMDISSLAVDGVFTYEHEAATDEKGKKITVKMPEQTVGKILKAKKIFGEQDCEDERELYFWKKCQTAYIYIMGELFDDYTDAARDLAGKFRYDSDRMDQNERTVMNFSIEGAYIAKEGIEVTRSVARKCTITVLPCNKAARAEMVPAQSSGSGKNNIDALFKTETIEIELFKTEPKTLTFHEPKDDMQKHADTLGIEPMKKNVIPFKKPLTSAPGVPTTPAPTGQSLAPKLPGATNNPGAHVGNTKTGKAVMSHARIHEYHGFSAADHHDAASLHHAAAQKATNPKMGNHHLDRMKLHLQAGKTAEFRENRPARTAVAIAAKQKMILGKTMDAGQGNVAPSQLTGTAALSREWLVNGKKKKLEKSWVELADEEYQKWDKRDQFVAFMQSRMPHLAKGEIDAIGKTLVLKKTVDAEFNLSKLIKK